MEVTLELVEQLRQHADVSFADAKAALEHTEGTCWRLSFGWSSRGKIDLAGGGQLPHRPRRPDPRQNPGQEPPRAPTRPPGGGVAEPGVAGAHRKPAGVLPAGEAV